MRLDENFKGPRNDFVIQVKKYKTLESWIKEALSDSDKESPCSALACIYQKPAGGTKEVHAVKLTGKTWDPTQLADLFKGKAEAFAQDFGGIQHFELQAFYGRTEAQATHTFSVVDGEVQAGGQNRRVHESPDGHGIVGQAMRHAEKAYEQLNTIVQQVAVLSIEREGRWVRREETLQREVSDAYTIIREMLMDKVKLDHDQRLKELEYQRSTDERKKFFELAPALANSVSGREIFPQNAADTALIEALANKVNPEHIQQLVKLGLVTQEVAGPLMIRLGEITKRKETERNAIKKLPPSSADPRQDAIGGNGLETDTNSGVS